MPVALWGGGILVCSYLVYEAAGPLFESLIIGSICVVVGL